MLRITLSRTLLGAAALLAWVAPLQATQAVGEPERDLQVPMRDGVVLLADRWWPEGVEGALPVLLVRTPYGRRLEESKARVWAARGYCVVVQAVRGRDGSEGVWFPWEAELEDGRETLEWLTQQDWCDGKVGMSGGSYLGHVQILAAACDHPALACVVPLSPGSDGFSDVPFSGGILCLELTSWLYSCRGPVLDTDVDWPASANDRSREVLPLSKVYDEWAGSSSEIWQRWVEVESLADMPTLRIWDRLEAARHKVPALHIGGLWDWESMATRRNWEQFGAHGGDDQYFVFGPWPHEPNQSRRYADRNYGEHALIDLGGMFVRWYRHWLVDSRSDLDLPRYQVFATGANRWLHLEQWPALDATPRSWSVVGEDGGLGEEAPAEQASWSWTYDPARVSRRGRDMHLSRSTRLWFSSDDEDALVLTSSPFEEATLLTGPVELELALSSSALDTDLFALLVEVSKSGTVRALQLPSPMRARFRAGFDAPAALVPGEVHPVVWSLGNFAHVFEPGSRLGVALRSEWFPVYARNLGTLEPLASATRTVVQENRIHSGGADVSALRLYQVPLERIQAD